MFYCPQTEGHGLAHNPFKALVAPRPIGWMSTLDAEGRVNLAPFSFFNAIADAPPMVMYSSNGRKPERGERKDTLENIRTTGEFVANIVSYAMRDTMNQTSAALPSGRDEFDHAGLEKAACVMVTPPRVAGAPAALECRLWRIITLPGEANHMVIGEVVGIHIDDAVIDMGFVDVTRYQPLARLGYRDYTAVREVFPLDRPRMGRSPGKSR